MAKGDLVKTEGFGSLEAESKLAFAPADFALGAEVSEDAQKTYEQSFQSAASRVHKQVIGQVAARQGASDGAAAVVSHYSQQYPSTLEEHEKGAIDGAVETLKKQWGVVG